MMNIGEHLTFASARRRMAAKAIARYTLIAAAGGAAFGLMIDQQGGSDAWLQGVFTGGLIALILSSIELTLRMRSAQSQLPFGVTLTLRTLVYLVAIVGCNQLGNFLFQPSKGKQPFFDHVFWLSLEFSLAAAFVFNFLNQINRMLGRNVLLSFILGRYHRPRVEQRIVLFLDLRQSTAIAERIGDLRYLGLLNRLWHELAGAVLETGGEIHKYVGDEAIVTWSLRRGARNGDCIRCPFLLRRRLQQTADYYRREFGVEPAFWAGIHCGSVVAGEMGSLRQEIALLGDTMNVAKRIEESSRKLGTGMLASQALVASVAMPRGIVANPVGSIPLAGKTEPMALYDLVEAGG